MTGAVGAGGAGGAAGMNNGVVFQQASPAQMTGSSAFTFGATGPLSCGTADVERHPVSALPVSLAGLAGARYRARPTWRHPSRRDPCWWHQRQRFAPAGGLRRPVSVLRRSLRRVAHLAEMAALALSLPSRAVFSLAAGDTAGRTLPLRLLTWGGLRGEPVHPDAGNAEHQPVAARQYHARSFAAGRMTMDSGIARRSSGLAAADHCSTERLRARAPALHRARVAWARRHHALA